MLLRLFAVLSGVALLALGAAGSVAAQEQGFTVSPHTITVTDGPNDEHTVDVDADLYVPDGVGASNRAPVVINAHGFGGSKETNDNGMNELLAEAGYVVFAYSSRGFGATTGRIGLDSIHYDVKDVVQLIDWLAARPEVQLDGPEDPRLGMVGPSYGGGIQLQVAGVDERVDVIVPFITWHSLVSSLSPNYLNTDLRLQDGRPIGVFKQAWTTLFYTLGNAQPVLSPEGSGPDGPCPGFVDPLCERYTETVAAGRASQATIDILKDSSPATGRVDNIDIPTLIVQGQADTLFTPNEAAANYLRIKPGDTPVKMIWHDGGHGYPYADGELELLQQRVLAWFDRHLRGDTAVQTGPGFEYYRRWVDGGVAQRYGAAGAFPVGRAVPLHLSADGALQPTAGDAQAGNVEWLSNPAVTSYSETPNFNNEGPDRPAVDPPGHAAEFTTPPLERPATVVGIPTVRFPLASTVGEAQLFVKLYDVAPDGSTTLVRRQVAALRATDLGEPLEAQLVGIAHRFAAGHRIRLVLASTDAAYANLRTPTRYTMAIEPGEAVLQLPLVGAGQVVVSDTDTPRSGGGNDATGAAAGSGTGLPTLPATGGGAAVLAGVIFLAGAAALRRLR